MLELHLSLEGFEVVTASDGRAAMDLLAGAAPDVVVTDLEMPRANGLELIKHLRADPRWQSVPILLFTAYNPNDPRLIAAVGVPHVTVHTKGSNVRALGGLLRSLIGRAHELEEVDAAEDRERRRGLETALARIADPGRRLPGETDTASGAEARRWHETYSELLLFKQETIATTREHHTAVGAPGRNEVELDIMMLEAERKRLAERAEFWRQRCEASGPASPEESTS